VLQEKKDYNKNKNKATKRGREGEKEIEQGRIKVTESHY
jgi:hypothetical protein